MKKDKDFKLKIVELVIQAVIALAALITAIKSQQVRGVNLPLLLRYSQCLMFIITNRKENDNEK